MSKTFKTGFTLGFYATKTDISAKEFGEGSFDKGIYFSIPLDLVSRNYRKNNARFVWKNLTKDGGAMLSGGLDFQGYVENSSDLFLRYLIEGLKNKMRLFKNSILIILIINLLIGCSREVFIENF